MILKQRRLHKFIWLFLTIAIPIVLFFAIKDLDFFSKSNTVKSEQLIAYKQGTTLQIQLNNPLKSSSSLVYEMDAKGEVGKVIGQLTRVGNYKFMVSSKLKGLVVIDQIKKEELFKIKF